MPLIILLLILFLILLIFYQLFLAHALNNNIFNGRIIEGVTNIKIDSTPPSNDEIYNQVKILSEKDQQNSNSINSLTQQVASLSEQVKDILLAQQSVLTNVV